MVELVSKERVWERAEEEFEGASDVMNREYLWIDNHTPCIWEYQDNIYHTCNIIRLICSS